MNIKKILLSLKLKLDSLFTSKDYWEARYRLGDNSGEGSYGALAKFKSQIINEFVTDNSIHTVIEYGCGDGNQLDLAHYKNYVGFDVTQGAIDLCRSKFIGDLTKKFDLLENYDQESAELTLSLDVIYHLIEDPVFESHMSLLFDSSTKFVIIYSSNKDKQASIQAPHVKHRKFTDWVSEERKDWKLINHIPNQYQPDAKQESGSFADFYIYGKI